MKNIKVTLTQDEIDLIHNACMTHFFAIQKAKKLTEEQKLLKVMARLLKKIGAFA